MKTFQFQFDDKQVNEVCQDINGNDDLISVFEVHLDGSHYEYLYKDNATGNYTSTPKSLLNAEKNSATG
jgi:hypothetical protein